MKILKYNIQLKQLAHGAGSPNPVNPGNLNDIREILKTLKEIEPFMGDRIFELTHKKNQDDDEIPPKSRRFLTSMKFLFSSHKLTHETTLFDEDMKILKFIYLFNYPDILDAINKLNWLFKLVNENFSDEQDFLNRLFAVDQHSLIQETIKEFREKNSLQVFSKTMISNLVNDAHLYFGKFKMQNDEFNFSREGTITFVNADFKKIGHKVLEESGNKIVYESDVVIDYEGNVPHDLKGVISFKDKLVLKQSNKNVFSEIDTDINEVLLEKYSDTNKNSTVVGVIDGGISLNSIVMQSISMYFDNPHFGWEGTPQGTHAEEVCSTILYANKLSNKTRDHLSTPDVYLFNVVNDDETFADIKNKIETIVKAYSSKIKIWNLSVIFEGYKDTEMISELGVFFDNLQKQENVIFILPTGNKVNPTDSKNIPAPAGSVFSFVVGGARTNGELVSYKREGYSGYFSMKPDLVTFSGDTNESFIVIKDNFQAKTAGTSFAAPLIARKFAYLLDKGFSILEIPAILNCYAIYYSTKNNINLTKDHGNGFIPVDATELINLVDNKVMFVIKTDVAPRYVQGFLQLKVPKNIENDKYDFSYYISTNVDAVTEKNSTYEYVLDSIRATFGKSKNDNGIQNWAADGRVFEASEEDRIESKLRKERGKYKNRDTFKKTIKNSIKTSFKDKKIEYDLKNWGIKLVRNTITLSERKTMPIAMCILLESKSNNVFYKNFIDLNIQNIVNIESEVDITNEYIEFS